MLEAPLPRTCTTWELSGISIGVMDASAFGANVSRLRWNADGTVVPCLMQTSTSNFFLAASG